MAVGGEVQQETRNYSEAISGTLPGRVKSDADDYRYFPDPDLVPVICPPEMVEEIRAAMPELPAARRARVQKEWELSDEELRDVVNAGALDPIEDSIKAGATPAGARKWWMGQIAVYAKDNGIELEEAPVTPENVAELDGLVASGKLTRRWMVYWPARELRVRSSRPAAWRLSPIPARSRRSSMRRWPLSPRSWKRSRPAR